MWKEERDAKTKEESEIYRKENGTERKRERVKGRRKRERERGKVRLAMESYRKGGDRIKKKKKGKRRKRLNYVRERR